MSASIENNVITLSNGVKKVVDYIDLFDEGVYGADNLFLRARLYADKTTDLFGEVKEAVNKLLSDSSSKYDINRLNVPNKKFFTDDAFDKSRKSPNRAQYRIQFLIRIHFYGDFGYLHFGIPWDDEDPAVEADLKTPAISDMKPLKWCWIADEEAKMIIDKIVQ